MFKSSSEKEQHTFCMGILGGTRPRGQPSLAFVKDYFTSCGQRLMTPSPEANFNTTGDVKVAFLPVPDPRSPSQNPQKYHNGEYILFDGPPAKFAAASGYRPQCFRSAALVGGYSDVTFPFLHGS
eukprot:1161599-Pelagomonas_calceolata.AAC.3